MATDRTRSAVLDALSAAIDSADLEHADLYAGAVLQRVAQGGEDPTWRQPWPTASATSTWSFLQQSYEHGEAAGEARGEATAVLEVLRARGIEVPDHLREQITSCRDAKQLLVWIGRAVVVTKVDELFDLPNAA